MCPEEVCPEGVCPKSGRCMERVVATDRASVEMTPNVVSRRLTLTVHSIDLDKRSRCEVTCNK